MNSGTNKFKEGQYVRWYITGVRDPFSARTMLSEPTLIIGIDGDYCELSSNGWISKMHQGGLCRDEECIQLERTNKLNRILK